MITFQIPDEALTQLSSLLERDGSTQWEIGKFINDYWIELLKYIPKDDIREQHAELIRQFAKGTRADRTTLRDREKMWVFFTDADRLEYGDVFSYHQFRALRGAGQEEWRLYAITAADEGWSVAQIRKAINKDKDPRQELLKDLTKIGKSASKLIEDEGLRPDIRESLCLIPSIIQDTKELV